MTDLTRCGAMLPVDGGQMVQRTWHPIGADGVICVTYDRSDGAAMAECATYRLHAWRVTGEYEPQNGSIGCCRRGRKLTRAEAERLVARWEG